MDPIPNEAWKSLERSRLRKRCLLLIASLGEAYVGQLSRMLGIPYRRVLALLHGKPPEYKTELALVTLGLVERKVTSTGRAYKITTRGLRKARSVTSKRARSAQRKAVHHAEETAGAKGQELMSFTWSVGAR